MLNQPVDYSAQELPGCPVLIAAGLYELDAVDRDAADRMLAEHIQDATRGCCDEHGFARPFELTSPTEMPRLRPITARPIYREVA